MPHMYCTPAQAWSGVEGIIGLAEDIGATCVPQLEEILLYSSNGKDLENLASYIKCLSSSVCLHI